MRRGKKKILRYLSMEGSQVAGWLWRNKPRIWRRWNNRLYCKWDESALKASRGRSRTSGPPCIKQLDSIWKQQWSKDVLFLQQWNSATSYPAIAHTVSRLSDTCSHCYYKLTAEPSLEISHQHLIWRENCIVDISQVLSSCHWFNSLTLIYRYRHM